MVSTPSPDRAAGPGRAERLADLSEEAVLARILPLMHATAAAAVWVGPGDDAALLRVSSGAVVATTDTMVRDRDWRDRFSTGADVGHKTVAQNLADVAAMGAVPTGLLVTLVADPQTPMSWVEDFADGLGSAARAARVPVIGGDLSSAPAGVLTVCVTALGELATGHAVLRSGASPGDVVALCGSLGLAHAGWRLLEQGEPDAMPVAVARQRRPEAPIDEGPVAARAGATSMIDISDGLLRDAARVAQASGARLDLSREALSGDVARLRPAMGERLAWECVLAGGEEHSLLATFPCAEQVPAAWRVIGSVQP
ncbi:MAG TPA: thiamine-phosphate kinase, partial [Candidatus Lustribacter sp.]|nr:thiamine-phosphate kinase [Candidatus Lustribacter sp.]